MMRPVALLLCLVIAPLVVGKGRAFAYTMEGYVYDNISSNLLRNTAVLIGKQLVTTDDRGWYSVRISGITCDRGDSRAEIERCNEAHYGELVIRRLFSGSSITLRTNWRRHACIDRVSFTPPCYISRRDLFLP